MDCFATGAQAQGEGSAQMRELVEFLRRQEERAAVGTAGGGASEDEEEAEEADMLAALGGLASSQGGAMPGAPGSQHNSQQARARLTHCHTLWLGFSTRVPALGVVRLVRSLSYIPEPLNA